MPITAKRKVRVTDSEEEKHEEQVIKMFVFRPYWFVLSQTGGDNPYAPQIPGFDIEIAFRTIDIGRVEFDLLDGNVQGFARERSIGVSPVAQLPHKTAFHEVAHVILGHTSSNQMVDTEATRKSLREVEAEAVAMICCEALELVGASYCRGYIQRWLAGEKEIPNQSAQRILTAATTILKAGKQE